MVCQFKAYIQNLSYLPKHPGILACRSRAPWRKISRKQRRGQKRLSVMSFPFLPMFIFNHLFHLQRSLLFTLLTVIHPNHALPLRIPPLFASLPLLSDCYFFCERGKCSQWDFWPATGCLSVFFWQRNYSRMLTLGSSAQGGRHVRVMH